jgi:hypothetical protein
MIKHNQDGQVSAVAVMLVFAVLLLIVMIGFGGWAFSSRQDYKNNTDQKITAAVTVAKQQESSAKDVAFAEAEKNPLRTYNGPEAYGSIVAQYPKTWSGYVDDTGNDSGALVDGYFYPGIVPSLTNTSSVFALRIQVTSQSYSDSLTAFTSLQQTGKLTISAYALPKLPKTVGVKVVGLLPNSKSGEMVVLPLRDKTLELWTEGSQFTPDFENNILPNFSFSP